MLLPGIETVITEQDKDVGTVMRVVVSVAGAEVNLTVESAEDDSFWRGKDLRLFRNSRCC